MYISILGRQPELGIAELESLYGPDAVSWFSDNTALVASDELDFNRLGGSQKAGRVVRDFAPGDPLAKDFFSVGKQIVAAYAEEYKDYQGKLTFGISAYGFAKITGREVQKTGLLLKSRLKKHGVSVRLVPSPEAALNSAASHHNKLGLSANKIELLVVRNQAGRVVVAESIGAQNITALAARDQGRPARDAFVGMLPPKLAQMLVNLSFGQLTSTNSTRPPRLLDPFCGTGVVLQEAALMQMSVYGTDLSEKMIRYSRDNLNWLSDRFSLKIDWYLHQGDAQNTQWQTPVDLIAGETYLGQPFSAPPSPPKLKEVVGNCNNITSNFLKNLHGQITPTTPVCIAVPAWRDANGKFTHLPLIDNLGKLGYELHRFKNVRENGLLYYREDQVVAREILVLRALKTKP